MKSNQQHSKSISYARAFLEELLNGSTPGSRLPGMRELIQNTGIGRIRLERILKEFEDRNLIEVRQRSGRYCKAVNTVPLIGFVHFSHLPVVESHHNFIGGVVYYLRIAASAEGKELITINASDLTADALLKILKERNISQLFTFGTPDASLINLLRKHIPFTVSLLPHYSEALGGELRDSPAMTDMQLKYLFQSGYRRIGYIHNVEENWSRSPVQLQRLMDYYRIMAEHGFKIEPDWVFYCGYNWEHFNSHMYKLMRSARKVEALIVPGSALKYIYKYCANNGITIGKELAVMGCDDIAPDLHPRATTVTNAPREIAEQSWQVMLDYCSGIVKSETTCLRIITGETVLPQHN